MSRWTRWKNLLFHHNWSQLVSICQAPSWCTAAPCCSRWPPSTRCQCSSPGSVNSPCLSSSPSLWRRRHSDRSFITRSSRSRKNFWVIFAGASSMMNQLETVLISKYTNCFGSWWKWRQNLPIHPTKSWFMETLTIQMWCLGKTETRFVLFLYSFFF